MKKLLCSIASLATAALTFVFLSISCMNQTVLNKTTGITGWDLLDKTLKGLDGNPLNGYTLFKIATIVEIVIACILAIIGIILLLQQFGVIKAKLNFRFVSAITLALFTVAAVLSMVGILTICGTDLAKLVDSAVGIGIILNVVVGAIATIIAFLFCRGKN